MKEDKRLFFIQLHENFFNYEDMIELEDVALSNGMNPNDLMIFYLKLILISLRNDGLIEFNLLTPQSLKAKLRFRSGLDREHDLKFIDQSLQLLKELGLVRYNSTDLYVMKALDLTMNKLEESQKRLEKRRSNKSKIASLLGLEKTNNQDFKSQLINDLVAIKYCCSESEAKEYIDVVDELKATHEEIISAMNLFKKRFNHKFDLPKITDKKNYLYNTLTNNLKELLKPSHEEQFDKFWNVYPKKENKAKCREWFETNNPSEDVFKQIINAINVQIDSDSWNEENGRFIPSPIKWLTDKRWEDIETLPIYNGEDVDVDQLKKELEELEN